MKRDDRQGRERGEEAVRWERIERRRQKGGLGVGKRRRWWMRRSRQADKREAKKEKKEEGKRASYDFTP